MVISEFDLFEIGDYSFVGDEAIIMTHTFENWVQRNGTVIIGNDCSVQATALLQPFSTLQENSQLFTGSVLTKGETVPHSLYYITFFTNRFCFCWKFSSPSFSF